MRWTKKKGFKKRGLWENLGTNNRNMNEEYGLEHNVGMKGFEEEVFALSEFVYIFKNVLPIFLNNSDLMQKERAALRL